MVYYFLLNEFSPDDHGIDLSEEINQAFLDTN